MFLEQPSNRQFCVGAVGYGAMTSIDETSRRKSERFGPVAPWTLTTFRIALSAQ
jgi:hypothetical protein